MGDTGHFWYMRNDKFMTISGSQMRSRLRGPFLVLANIAVFNEAIFIIVTLLNIVFFVWFFFFVLFFYNSYKATGWVRKLIFCYTVRCFDIPGIKKSYLSHTYYIMRYIAFRNTFYDILWCNYDLVTHDYYLLVISTYWLRCMYPVIYIQYLFARKVQSIKRCIQKISAANIVWQ